MQRKIICTAIILLIGSAGPGVGSADFFATTLKKMKSGFDRMVDYRCQYEIYSAKGDKTTDLSFAYYFQKPKMIRMEVIKGKHPGTVMLYHREVRDGKVKVRVGNPVLAALQNAFYGDYFDLHDKKVTELGGFGIMESDWGWLIDIHRQLARFGQSTFEGEEWFDGRKTLRYTIVSAQPQKTIGIAKEELWVDSQTFFPVQFIHYNRQGMITRKACYRNVTLNAGLNEKLFLDFDEIHR